MPKNTTQLNTKKSFLNWLHTYRTKLALSMFVILIPIMLIVIGYVSPYIQSTRVSFDSELTDESTYVRNFIALDELEDITLYVDWLTLTKPTENVDGNLEGGSLSFRITYDVKNNKDINDVTVTAVLQPLYTNIRNITSPRVIFPYGTTSSQSIFTVVHNVSYPLNPMLFVNINDPILYLKITYNEVLIDQVNPVQVTEYIRVPLSDLNPDKVN
jgi:hypothetical protein